MSIVYNSQIYTSVAGSPYKIFNIRINSAGLTNLDNAAGLISLSFSASDIANAKISIQNSQEQLSLTALKLTVHDLKTETEPDSKILDNVPLFFAISSTDPKDKNILKAFMCIADFVRDTPRNLLKNTLPTRMLEIFQNYTINEKALLFNNEILIDSLCPFGAKIDNEKIRETTDKNSTMYGMPLNPYSSQQVKQKMDFTPIYTSTADGSNVSQPRWDQSYLGTNTNINNELNSIEGNLALLDVNGLLPSSFSNMETPEFKTQFDAFCTEASLPDIPGRKKRVGSVEDDDNFSVEDNIDEDGRFSIAKNSSSPGKAIQKDFEDMTFEFAGGKYNYNSQKQLPIITETDIESIGIFASNGENYGEVINISATKLSFYKNYRLLVDSAFPKAGIPVPTGNGSTPIRACNFKVAGSYSWVIGMDNGFMQTITANKTLLEKLNFEAFFKKFTDPLDRVKFFTKLMGVDLSTFSSKRIYLNHQVKHAQLQILDMLQIDSHVAVLISSPADNCSYVALVDSFDLVNKRGGVQNVYGKSCMKIEGRMARNLIPLATSRISKTSKKCAFGVVEKTGNVVVIAYNFSTEIADNERWNADTTYKRLEFVCNFKEFVGLQTEISCNERSNSPIISVRTSKYNEFILCAVMSKNTMQAVKYQMGTYDFQVPNTRNQVVKKLCFSVKQTSKISMVSVVELAAAMLATDPQNLKRKEAERTVIEIPKPNDEICTAFNIVELNHSGTSFQPTPPTQPQLTDQLYDDDDLIRDEVNQRAKNMGVYMADTENESLDFSPVLCFTTKDNVLIVGVLQTDLNEVKWEICDLRKRFANLTREFSILQILQANDGLLLYIQGPGNNKLAKLLLKCRKVLDK